MDYIKHFNQQSDRYLRFRPDYPKSLYDYLLTVVIERGRLWDCGTGNGQVAFNLAGRFEEVFATDINEAPLELALKKSNIRYLCTPAEKTPIESSSVDLVTVAQALHWFNLNLFYEEVRRVAKDSAIIAAWCYSLGKFGSEIDQQMSKLYDEILGDAYWPAERSYIDQAYQTIPFPFKRKLTPSFEIEKRVNLSELLGYLSTWSAVKEYESRNKRNPIDYIIDALASIWGDPSTKYKLTWPVHLLVGAVNERSSNEEISQ